MNSWQRVESLFLKSVDLPAEEQSRFLEESCAGDPALLHELQSLIAADTDSGMAIEAAVRSEAEHFLESDMLVGERLGNYRVVREIGRGGMGAVYLATRSDGEYSNDVAIKVVKRGMDTVEVLARFRYERQILANLTHPQIARLFDGGSTPDGLPFLVMEYIEGKPIHVFCEENGLGFDQRCRLFLSVLEAVAYAHRNLVVHRDLKPSNILVTQDGTTKLLDFGVAKLLGGDASGDRTSTSSRTYTPAYASPEQVLGNPVTTSTDIYSLGAVLYELLTGQRAQPIEAPTPAAIERRVCEIDVPRPSLVVKALPSDLDNIVLMAMRKEPERRYQSAAQFGEDIQRYLDGRPVIALQDSAAYRVRKFILRNRLEVAMAAVVTVSLITAVVFSLAQARRADKARDVAESQRAVALHETAQAEAARLDESQQRTVAEQQRAIANDRTEAANQRVKDILGLANRTLFDVHDAIAPLPGSVAARRTLVSTTLAYLESLQARIGMDDQMREVLGSAYYKVALIQGDPEGSSLQDTAGAETNLRKAQALLQPAFERDPKNVGITLRWLQVRALLLELIHQDGEQQKSMKNYAALLPIAHRLAQSQPENFECQYEEAALESSLAVYVLATDTALSLTHAKHSAELTRALIVRYPARDGLKSDLGSIAATAAGAYQHMGDLENAAESYRQSIEMREPLLEHDPNNADLNRNLLIVYGNYSALLGIPWSQNLGRPAEAHIYAAKAVTIARALVQADPQDATARHNLGMILGRSGMIDPAPEEAAASLADLEEAQRLIEPLNVANPKSAQFANQLAIILEYKGHRMETLGRKADASATYRSAMALLQPLIDQPASSSLLEYIANEESLALLDARTGNAAAALKLAREALVSAEKLSLQTPVLPTRIAGLAKAWATLAVVQSESADSTAAAQSAKKAMDLWQSVRNPGILTAFRKLMDEIRPLLPPGGTE